MIQGIDVSSFQGAFPWQDWRGRIGFGMCKATEGGMFTDPAFGRNWDGMLAMDPCRRFPRFAYHYFRPAQDPVVQAAHLVSTVKGRGLLPGDNFVLDLEVSDGELAPVVANRAAQFLHKVNGLAPGHRVLVYTNPSFAQAGNCAGLGSWFLWIADYGVPQPAVPPPWREWTFWQHGDSPLDLDVFNGSEEQLLQFCRMPATR